MISIISCLFSFKISTTNEKTTHSYEPGHAETPSCIIATPRTTQPNNDIKKPTKHMTQLETKHTKSNETSTNQWVLLVRQIAVYLQFSLNSMLAGRVSSGPS